MVRMNDDRLTKRSETKKQGGCWKRGRPQLTWEDCAQIDLLEERQRKTNTGQKRPTTGSNGKITKVAVQAVQRSHK